MIKSDREKIILNWIEKNGSIQVCDIVRECDVSVITARRDLTGLEQMGQIIRTHGGAVQNGSMDQIFSFSRRLNRRKWAKIAIAKSAATFIKKEEVIFIDCGTTLFHLCDFIHHHPSLKVITNSVPVVYELMKHPQIKTILVGGEVYAERRAVYGPVAMNHIASYHADKAFIGTDGISLDRGLTSYDENEAHITKSMMQSSDQVILLCDSSKIETNSVYKYADLDIVDYIITDHGLKDELYNRYKETGVQILRTNNP